MSFLRILPASVASFFNSKPSVDTFTDINYLQGQAKKNGHIKAAEIYSELIDLGYKSTDEVSEAINGLYKPLETIDVDSIFNLFQEHRMPTSLVYKIAGFNYEKINSVPGLNIFISFDAVKLTSLMLIREREFNARRQEERFERTYGYPVPEVAIIKFRQTIAPANPPIPQIESLEASKRSAA